MNTAAATLTQITKRANQRQVLSISSLAVNKIDKSLLFVKREKYPNKGTYSLPGGRLEISELISEGQMRETLEETGYLTAPFSLEGIECSKAPPTLVTELVSDNGTTYLIMTSLYEIVGKDEGVVETDCEFEFFGIYDDHPELEWYKTAVNEGNSTPGILKVIDYFSEYFEQV